MILIAELINHFVNGNVNMAKIMKRAQTGKNVPKGMVESEMFPGKMIPKSKSNYTTGNYSKMLGSTAESKMEAAKAKAKAKPKAQLGGLLKGIVKSGVKKAEKSAVKTIGQQEAKTALRKAIEKRTKPTSRPSFFDEFDMPVSKSANSQARRESGLKKGNARSETYVPFKSGGMLKRADGSYSKRGLWDNIRANRGSGKKPTAAMLKQEKKIKAKSKK